MKAVFLRAVSCAVFALGFVGIASAQLKPFQQDALDAILETIDPPMRPMMRAQLQATIGILNEEQVAMMLESLTSNAESSSQPAEVIEEVPVTEEDLAYNRAQYEPVIRRAWQAAKAFDDFVEGKLGEHCTTDKEFAVFGLAWRYEVYPLDPNWPNASQGADLDVQIIGASYAPQDGRYDFDFSEVRTDFDAAAVERAIVTACAEYAEIGATFLAEARADTSDDLPPNGMQIEGRANSRAGAVREALEEVLQAQAPNGNNAVLMALINGERVE